ncbi:zinc-dependent alcohol dehydrogenase [Microbacterium sp. AGC85]
MRAGIITGLRRLDMRDVAIPAGAVSGTAVVRIRRTGICGSDVAAFRDGEEYPAFLSGHEWVGEVLDVAADVTNVRIGDRVVAGTPAACGHCAMCLRGNWERCAEYSSLAFGTHPLTPSHGGYSERIAMPAESLITVPTALADDDAAVVEPAAVALHAVRRAPSVVGTRTVVIGAGPVGLFVTQMLAHAGAAEVIVIEPRERRRELAHRLGATGTASPSDSAVVIMDRTGGLGADVVFDCVGNEPALKSASEVARPGGTIMLVGAATSDIRVSPLTWLSKELTVRASLAHLNHEFHTVMQMMVNGSLSAAPLIDRIVGLDGLEGALNALADGEDAVKVLVDPALGTVVGR